MTHAGTRRRLVVLAVAVAAVAVVALATSTGSLVPSALEQGARSVDPDALATPACTEVAAGDPRDRDHLDPADAPPPEALYDTDLPAAGPHFGAWSRPVAGFPDTALDVRALLHNLEHGAVVLWLDPDLVGAGTLDFVTSWRDQLGSAGFDNDETGAAVFLSRMPGHVERGEVAVALRAWGVALDCTRWELAVADAFVGLHYGTRGGAPEADLGPWPSGNGVLVGPPGADDSATTTV